MSEDIFNPIDKEESEYSLLARSEDECDEDFLKRIVEEYKEAKVKQADGFKNEVRLYLYNEQKLLDRQIGDLLEENPKIIATWRRRNDLEPNYWERKPKEKKENIKENYHRTEREKDLVVKFVLRALNCRKDPEHSLKRASSLRGLLDKTSP